MQRLLIPTLILLLTACGGGSGNGGTDNNEGLPPLTEGDWYRPAPLVTWQWQLTGTVNVSYAVDLYDIDLFDSSIDLIQSLQTANRKVICYFSAGSYENWREDAGAFQPEDLGNALDGWPGERWLDIRNQNVRNIMKARLDLAAQKGCDGVEPDNMDGYTNQPGLDFNAFDQREYNRWLANEAHTRNLSVGLKNDLDQISALVDYFDFAVNEQCFEYDECDALQPFISRNKPVLNAEYKASYVNDTMQRNALCVAALNQQFSTLVLPVNLDDSFRYSCN